MGEFHFNGTGNTSSDAVFSAFLIILAVVEAKSMKAVDPYRDVEVHIMNSCPFQSLGLSPKSAAKHS